MGTQTFDIRQLIARIDPDNVKRKTETYRFSNERRFLKDDRIVPLVVETPNKK